MSLLKLSDKENDCYKYAIKQEISRAHKGTAAPHAYPPTIDLHPIINNYRNSRCFQIESDKEDGWYEFLQRKLKPSKLGLTLGSGEARHEKKLSELGLVEKWVSVDLADNPLDTFTSNDNNEFIHGDLNFIELPKNRFDIIYCHGVLHHIVNLEHLLLEINNALAPDGVFVVYEYVGEKKWQWDNKKFELLRIEVENNISKKIMGLKFKRKPLYFMNERPLESIRSSDIPGLINEIFITEYESHWNRLIYPFINGIEIPRKYFKEEKYISQIINYAIELEEKYHNEESLLPTELNGIYGKNVSNISMSTIPWKADEIEQFLGPIEAPILERLRRDLKKIARKLLKGCRST